MFDGSAKKLRSVFLVGFLLTIALALTGYIDSSFVGTYVGIERIGVLFSLGSIASIVFLAYLPKILARFGVTNIFHAISAVYLVSVFGMLYLGSVFLFQILFIIYLAGGIAIYFLLDILIEHYSKDGLSGGVRGFYLALYNLAYLVGPLLAGFILESGSFETAYLMAGVFIIIMTLLYLRNLEKAKIFSHHNGKSLWRNFLRLSKNKNLFSVYLVSLSLSFFFSWMAIYTPIYLFQIIGFGWDQIGAIFAIMHIPYVTLEVPLGRLADRWNCERELASAGLAIIALATTSLSFLIGGNFWVWAAALALTRVGASFIQVSTESYFFRRVSEKESDMIAVYRNASPVAYILGPLIATLALTFIPFKSLFLVLGIIMALVIFISLKLRDENK